MVFLGKPGMLVTDGRTGVAVGVFNAEGRLAVEDPEWIRRMEKRFEKAAVKGKRKEVKADDGKGCV